MKLRARMKVMMNATKAAINKKNLYDAGFEGDLPSSGIGSSFFPESFNSHRRSSLHIKGVLHFFMLLTQHGSPSTAPHLIQIPLTIFSAKEN